MRPGKKSALKELLAGNHHVSEQDFRELLEALAPVSESYLRKLLRESGVPLAPAVEGVRQESFEALRTTLERLLEEYETGDAVLRKQIRALVITAKDHARLAARNPEHRQTKQEMILWMLTWLENPPLFPAWVKLRISQNAETAEATES